MVSAYGLVHVWSVVMGWYMYMVSGDGLVHVHGQCLWVGTCTWSVLMGWYMYMYMVSAYGLVGIG